MAINRDKILREAEKLVQKGKIEPAIREYEKLLKANPNDANTINRVGDLYGRIGQVDRAIELYEQIANHFTEDGFTTKAIAILKKINRLAPQRLDIFARLAELYMQQGLVVEATSQYRILADWYVKNDQADDAIEAHRKLVQLDPSNHMANLKLADLLVQNGDVDDAVEVYDRLGRMLLERDKLEEAERLYRHALEQGPIPGDLVAPLVERQLDGGRTDAARETLEGALERSPDSQVLRGIDIRLRLATGQAAEAMERAEELVRNHPDDRELRLQVGRALLASGEAVAARNMMIPVVEQLLTAGDFLAAQQMARELLQRMSQDQQVLEVAVRAYRPSNDRETLATISAALADSYFKSGRSDAARRLYLDLLEDEPDNQLFRQRLSQLDGGAPPSAPAPETPGDSGAAAIDGDEESEPEIIEIAFDPDEQSAAVEPSAPQPVVEARPPVQVSFDPDERFAEANVFAKYGLVDKAISHLEQILEAVPDHRGAREKLVAMYVEDGRPDDATAIAAPLVAAYRDAGDTASIEALRSTLPNLDLTAPTAAVAPAMDDAAGDDEILLEIDADELVAGGEVSFDAFDDTPTAAESQGSEDGFGGVSFDEPDMVEYDVDRDSAEDEVEDLEEPIELDEAIEELPPVQETDTPAAAPMSSGALGELDELERLLGSASGPAERTDRAPSPPPPSRPEPPSVDEAAEPEELVEISDGLEGPPIGDLEQLDFFLQQELYDDAVRILEQLEASHPGNAELAERRLRLKSKGLLLEDVPAASEAPEDLFADEDDYIDLAAELEEELAAEEAMVDEATGRGQDEALLEEVFREFQKGVAEQLSEEDSDTHFNLGIAYKEMGLLPEAIREFQISSRNQEYFIESCSMIGVCYLDQGMPEQAAEWYERALAAPHIGDDAVQALRYDLASSLEAAGEPERAVELFEQICAGDPDYRDVGQRLAELGERRQAN